MRAEYAEDQNHRIASFGNPPFLGLLRRNTHSHFDTIFNSWPKYYKQMDISVILDNQIDACALAMRVLIAGKFDIKHKASNQALAFHRHPGKTE